MNKVSATESSTLARKGSEEVSVRGAAEKHREGVSGTLSEKGLKDVGKGGQHQCQIETITGNPSGDRNILERLNNSPPK